MGRSRLYPQQRSTNEEIVARGLDPRTLYPRCDFCANKARPAGVQIGRWWAHESCACAPDNHRLACAQLKTVDYSTVASRGGATRQVHAMLIRTKTWAADALKRFREAVRDRGDTLERPVDLRGIYS